MHPRCRPPVLLIALVTALAAVAARAAGPTTTLVTRGLQGAAALAGANSTDASVSDDGRYVAFLSDAINLGAAAPGITNAWVRDRMSGAFELVSQSTGGTPADNHVLSAAISGNGRFVAYWSLADNLVPGDHNGLADLFVRDRLAGTTARVTVGWDGSEAGGGYEFYGRSALAISPDGRFIAFCSGIHNLVSGAATDNLQVYLADRLQGTTERVSNATDGGPADQSCGTQSLGVSADGRLVTFDSSADNLTADGTGQQVYIRDRRSAATYLGSITGAGAAGDAGSTSPSLSPDGRFLLFVSDADDLIDGTVNGPEGVYLHDLSSGTTQRVDLDNSNQPMSSFGPPPALSGDGRYVLFPSDSLLPAGGPSFGPLELYVRDRASSTTTLISAGPGGVLSDGPNDLDAVAVTPDGHAAVFSSDAPNLVPADRNGTTDVFFRDLIAGSTDRVSEAETGVDALTGAHCREVVLTPDGRFAVFESDASNLVDGDTNGMEDVFVWDRLTGAYDRVNVTSSGEEEQYNAAYGFHTSVGISADGRFVVFSSEAANLSTIPHGVSIFLRDRLLGTTTLISPQNDGLQFFFCYDPAISADGQVISFVSPDPAANAVGDQIWVVDRSTGRATLGSAARDGSPADGYTQNPVLSADGRYVAFMAVADNLAPGGSLQQSNIYLHDRVAGTTEMIGVQPSGAPSAGSSLAPAMSADGRYIAFASMARDLVPGDQGASLSIYVRDRRARKTERMDVPHAPEDPSLYSFSPSISPDGRFVTFTSSMATLVPGDTNGVSDIFLYDRRQRTLERVSISATGAQTTHVNDPFDFPTSGVSADGRFILFSSLATDLVPGGTAGNSGVFLRDRSGTAASGRVSVPRRLHLGPVSAGQSTVGYLPVRNLNHTSELVLHLASPGGPFSVPAPDADAVVPPGATVKVPIVFRPTAAGRVRASLTIATSDPAHPSLKIVLDGTAR